MHVLVTLWDGGGTVPVEAGVVRRVVARGHTVTALADPPMERQLVDAGATFRPWRLAPHRSSPDDPDLIDDVHCRTPLQVLDRILGRLMTGPAGAFADDVTAELAARPADVVVSDGALLGALVGAEVHGVPSVALCPNIYLRPTPGLPPFGSGLRPAIGPLGRTAHHLLHQASARLWERGRPALDAARRQRGLDPLTSVWEQWDRAARVLVLTSAAFDLPARLPANVRYGGPVLDDPVWCEPFEPPAGTEPLVVAGLTSTRMRGTIDVLRRIVAALDTLPVRAVVPTGPTVDPADVPGTPRVAVVRSVPHAQLFPRADVVITHAGHGTLMKALAAGVPALCLPMGRDQKDNVVRAERHGSVLRLRPDAPPDAIADAVQRLLVEPRFRAGARRLGAVLRADAASGALVDEIEAAARGTARPDVRPPTRGDAR
jgi:UDP:flavonoid glycosyltransferase YjiC (YdhE family)